MFSNQRLPRAALDPIATTMTNPTADEPVGAAPVRNEEQTQIRASLSAPVIPLTAPLFADASPLNLDALPPSHTESDWIEPDPQAAEMGATVGTLLGNRYLLEYKVGEGGMGEVYRATDVEVKGEIFAVKVLKPAIQRRPEALKLLREEVRKTRGLKHPNIVGVYSLNSDPSGAYMLMEFLEGKSLNALMDEEFGRGMPLMRAWPLINDIGAALAYAHDHNVIHSDLKPSNLFVTVSGKAMLLDFGIARAVHARSDRFDTGSLGALTPAYASSEMLTGNAPDQSDDVYSFACVIYEMLSGKHPFNSLGAIDAQRAGLHLAALPSLTHRQNHALARALAFERAERTASVEALLSGLKGPAQRRPQSLIWLATGAAACIVAGAAAWMAWHGRASEHARIASQSPAPSRSPSPVLSASRSPSALPAPSTSPAPAPSLSQSPAPPRSPSALPSPGPSASRSPLPAPSTSPAPAPSLSSSPAPPRSPSALPSSPGLSATLSPAASALPFPSPTPSPARAVANADRVAVTAAPGKDIAAGTSPEPVRANTTDQAATAAAKPVRDATVAVLANEGRRAAAPDSKPSPTVQGQASSPASGGAAASLDPPESTATITPAIAGAASAPPILASQSVAATNPDTTVTNLAAVATNSDIGGVAPIGKKVPAIVPLPASKFDSCPYPEEARRQVETGTVVLLVYVSPEGAAANTQIDTSSGSASLDQAAVVCVQKFGQFAPRTTGKRGSGYWGRMKFTWSFDG